jgi:hypothetical protein
VNGSVPVPSDSPPGTGTTPSPNPGGGLAPRTLNDAKERPGDALPGASSSGRTPAGTLPVVFTFERGRLTPSARFIARRTPLQLKLVAADGAVHRAALAAGLRYPLTARPGAPATLDLPGLEPGRYRITSDRGHATLVVQRSG